MTARATLTGNQFDLDALVALFPIGDPRVVRTGDETFLEASALDDALHAKDGARLIEVAGGYLKRMNGAAALCDASYRPVVLANQFHRDNHRHINIIDEVRGRDSVGVVFAEVRLSATATMLVGGVPAVLPPEGPKLLTRAAVHRDVDELLALIGSVDALGWDTMWKAMEIIRQAVDGKAALLATGWITATAFDEFGYAANEPTASGDAARHARRPPKSPPARIMTIEEGRQFIRDLIWRWLDSLP